MNGGSVLVVDDVVENIGVLVECLKRERYRVLVAQDGASALERARNGRPDAILLDVMLPGIDGFEICRRLKADPITQSIPVIFITALDDTQDKIKGFSTGGTDYLTKPFQYEEVVARVNTHVSLRRSRLELEEAKARLEERVRDRTAELQRALREVEQLKERLQAENDYLQTELGARPRTIVGESVAIRALLGNVARVGVTDATVLIAGETGVGKELVARAIHDASRRRDRTMVMLNCAAISSGLVENELFGHVKGAYTGATDRHIGRFQLADGGTLFLDEVTELPLETQVKLLRVLQEREFEPVGSSQTQRVDVRLIAASNRNLEVEVREGRFRADLFYRLNVFPIAVPALRERIDDIPLLIRHFVDNLARRMGRSITHIEARDIERLQTYPWPGNVRELQNVIERAIVYSTEGRLVLDWFDAPQANTRSATAETTVVAGSGSAPGMRLADVERDHILTLLRRTGGVIEGPRGVAKLLDMKPSTARHRIRKLGIRKTEYLD